MVLKLNETIDSIKFVDVLKNITIDFHEFLMSKCDERTFYISINIRNGNDQEVCDLIFILDRPTVLGAISLNEKYDKIRHFFKKHFDYELSYSDEQRIAKLAMTTVHFKQCLQQFSSRYPKHLSNIQLLQ